MTCPGPINTWSLPVNTGLGDRASFPAYAPWCELSAAPRTFTTACAHLQRGCHVTGTTWLSALCRTVTSTGELRGQMTREVAVPTATELPPAAVPASRGRAPGAADPSTASCRGPTSADGPSSSALHLSNGATWSGSKGCRAMGAAHVDDRHSSSPRVPRPAWDPATSTYTLGQTNLNSSVISLFGGTQKGVLHY